MNLCYWMLIKTNWFKVTTRALIVYALRLVIILKYTIDNKDYLILFISYHLFSTNTQSYNNSFWRMIIFSYLNYWPLNMGQVHSEINQAGKNRLNNNKHPVSADPYSNAHVVIWYIVILFSYNLELYNWDWNQISNFIFF